MGVVVALDLEGSVDHVVALDQLLIGFFIDHVVLLVIRSLEISCDVEAIGIHSVSPAATK
jgi:hypothetical protein